MDDRTKQHAVEMLVKLLLEMLTPDMLKDFVKHILTFARDAAKKTTNPFDDAIVGGLCAKIEDSFELNK